MVELRNTVLEDANTSARLHRSLNQRLIGEFISHDHELALRHRDHVVARWIDEYEKPRTGG